MAERDNQHNDPRDAEDAAADERLTASLAKTRSYYDLFADLPADADVTLG